MIKKTLTALAIALTIGTQTFAQANGDKPKMVVGIIVDQMRPEYLYKYQHQYSEDGFNRLMTDGFNNTNTHFNYIPTYTGPGHTSVYTGSTPAIHGIIGNTWFNKSLNRFFYCAEDTTHNTVGNDTKNGQISPKNMLVTTIGDELRMSNNYQSKVVGISLKDRGAALPAGHTANAAYWFDFSDGKFISSDYYMDTLPDWMQSFNSKRLADQYMDQTWELSLEASAYDITGEDDNPMEHIFDGRHTATFPYNLKEIRKDNGDVGMLNLTPYGNTILVDLAMATIDGEQLGQGEFTDMLALSFSTPDAIGHNFGPQAVELHDMYLKLDQEIARLLSYLDEKVGEGEYLVFLTSDHGAANAPKHAMERKLPAGFIPEKELGDSINIFLQTKLGDGSWVKSYSNQQVFLDREAIMETGEDLAKVQRIVADHILNYDNFAATYTAYDLQNGDYGAEGLRGHLIRGYHQKRSGDVAAVYDPGYIGKISYATTHSSGYNYDTHAPLLWYGWNIEAGKSSKYETITSIAPTISQLLQISLPSGATGTPIKEVVGF